MENSIELDLQEWAFNAGITGIYKILRNWYGSEELEGLVSKNEKNKLIIDPSVLDNFSEKYFKYFDDTYGSFMPYGKIIGLKSLYESYLDRNFFDYKELENVNKNIDTIKNKVSSNSYQNGLSLINYSGSLLSEVKKLEKIKLKKGQEEYELDKKMKETFSTIINICKIFCEENVKKIFLAKDFVNVYTSDFLQNVAIWGKEGAQKNPYEVYNDYFIKPLNEYLETDNKTFKDVCSSCNSPIQKSKYGYSISWVKAMGVDDNRKQSVVVY